MTVSTPKTGLNRRRFVGWAAPAVVAAGGGWWSVHSNEKRSDQREVLVDVVRGNNHFACDLFRSLAARTSGNLFFSPHSISTALAMTYACARGGTESQMAHALNCSKPQAELHPAFAHLSRALKPTGGRWQLDIANRLWAQRGYDFLPEYFKLTRDYYGAEVANLDFRSDAEAARNDQAWIEDQTHRRIRFDPRRARSDHAPGAYQCHLL